MSPRAVSVVEAERSGAGTKLTARGDIGEGAHYEKLSPEQRRQLVNLARRGVPLRELARQFRLALSNVQYWLRRAAGQRLQRVQFADLSRRPHRSPTALSAHLVKCILALRDHLQRHDALGEFGPVAIGRALRDQFPPGQPLPSRATIANVLQRHAVVGPTRRQRRPAPPPGWHLPAVAAAQAELDAFDVVEGLVIQGRGEVQILNGISLHGSLCASFSASTITARYTIASLLAHWRTHGLPTYVQFDNDLRFHGPHHHPDRLGSVVLFCLALGVIPVFAPPREHGLQNQIESFNHLWQAKVWHRFHHASPAALRHRSDRFVTAHHHKTQARQDTAPPRQPWPPPRLPARADPTVIFIRRTDDAGRVSLLAHRLLIAPAWPHRLVRCELRLRSQTIRGFALRRSQPDAQPLLATFHAKTTPPHFADYLRRIATTNSTYAG